jgi:hypothetical protein
VDSETVSSSETLYETYAKTGLSSEEVEKKLQQFGFNRFLKRKLIPSAIS